MPPWIQHSHLQTQQELCAKRFLRFASLLHVHGAVVLWCMTLWRHGVDPIHAWAPLMYFTAPVLFKHRLLPSCSIEYLSVFILAMNGVNAVHLASLASGEGGLVLSSPLYACLPLSRVLFGLFTQEVHWHVLLSTAVALVTVLYNQAMVSSSLVLAVTSCLIIELTAVVVLAGGPCGYEEAILHLAQCRLQHQLTRSQAIQRIDVEREELSGQLLSIATEVMAELTASVQRASDPVLSMLKSSCATGTKSAQEAERIGRIGEALQSEVAELLRYKTQEAWTRLQDRAKERIHQLKDFSRVQQAASQAMLKSIHSSIGRSLAEMHELELEAETSLNQLIQGEINRAMEIADARMDLVRQSAQAMERRVSDTVEVLLYLLKYFRAKGGNGMAPPHVSPPVRLRLPRSAPATDTQAAKALPSIEESLHGECSPTSTGGQAPTKVETPSFCFEADDSEEQEHPSPRSRTLSLDNEGPDVGDGEVREEVIMTGPLTGAPCQEVDPPQQFRKRETRALPGGRRLLLPPARKESSTQAARCDDSTEHFLPAESSCDDRSAFTEDESDREVDRKSRTTSKDYADDKDEKDFAGAARAEVASDRGSSRHGEGEVASDRDDSSSVHTASVWHAWSPTSQSSLPGLQRKMQSPLRGLSVPRDIFDRHPLFASRLCYQSEEFFWSWASSADFRAETDALRAWRRAETMEKEGGDAATTREPTPPPDPLREQQGDQSEPKPVWPGRVQKVNSASSSSTMIRASFSDVDDVSEVKL